MASWLHVAVGVVAVWVGVVVTEDAARAARTEVSVDGGGVILMPVTVRDAVRTTWRRMRRVEVSRRW